MALTIEYPVEKNVCTEEVFFIGYTEHPEGFFLNERTLISFKNK